MMRSQARGLVGIGSSFRISLIRFALIAASLLGPAAGYGADGEESGGDIWNGVEEMIVVGSPAFGAANKETISVIGFDAETLQKEGITDISDLSKLTPNLEINTAFAASNPTLFIRGVGLDDFNANSASAVAVYQDGIYMNSPAGQLFQLFDVARVEVLRGPQGTLRNASAGAIRVFSNKPTDVYETSTTVTYGRFNQVNVEGVLSGPIIPDYLLSRFAFAYNRRDGITKNRCADLVKQVDPTPCGDAVGRPLKKWANDIDNWAVRGTLSGVVPLPRNQEAEWLFNVHGGENNSQSSQFQHRGWQKANDEFPLVPGRDVKNYADNDGDPFEGDYNFQGDEDLSLIGGSLSIKWSPHEQIEIASLSGYEYHDRDTRDNGDANPRDLIESQYTDDAWQFSEELTMKFLWHEANEIIVGGYLLREDLHSDNRFLISAGNFPRIFTQTFDQDTRGWAVFGSTHLDLPEIERLGEWTGNFSIDAGARYNSELKRFDTSATNGRVGAPVRPNEIGGQTQDKFTGVSGSASLNYEVSEWISVYAKYSRGWKPGHFNGGVTDRDQIVDPVKPETVDSIELGVRSNWFDGLLSVDLTGFFYDYDNLQVFLLEQNNRGFAVPQLINAKRAEVQGFEVEIRAEPIEALEVYFSLGYLDSEYVDFQNSFNETEFVPGQGVRPIIRVIDYSGSRLVASPEWSVYGSVQYTFSIPFRIVDKELGALRPYLSAAWKDDVFYDPNEGAGQKDNLAHATIGQEAFWLLNASLSWLSPDERWEVSGWVNNFLDEEHVVQAFDLSDQQRLTLHAYGDPRTYGLTVSMYWGGEDR